MHMDIKKENSIITDAIAMFKRMSDDNRLGITSKGFMFLATQDDISLFTALSLLDEINIIEKHEVNGMVLIFTSFSHGDYIDSVIERLVRDT